MILKELTKIEEMLPHLALLNEMYPNLTSAEYANRLEEMVPFRYAQVGVFEGEDCVGISGYWLHTKVWIGRILELDNVIIKKEYRGKGAGKLIQDYLENKAKENNCRVMVLDAFVTNFAAHKFYMNAGYVAKGYHFVKPLDPQIDFMK
ncbi:MAG: GNAT family N-acetyltransferase [Bacteroidetes bacterium]|nr:GNAT family N-acetyltransferase [Bacteroidota bacterium]